MKVSIELSPEYRIPYAVIYADKITDEIQKIMESFSRQETPITALQNEDNLVVLQPEEMASIDGALNHMEMSEVFGGSRISQKN